MIEIATARDNDALLLHIRDDGRSLAGQVPGMGLGLPMVASLLWRIGGLCQIVNREPGPGVEVEIRIPFAERV